MTISAPAIPHDYFTKIISLADFPKTSKKWRVVRRIEGEGFILTLADAGAQGYLWCVQQPAMNHQVVIYNADQFETRIGTLADMAVRDFVRIRRLIRTDQAQNVIGPRSKVRGKVYVMHASDVSGPHDEQPGATR